MSFHLTISLISDFIFFFFSSRRRHTRCSRDWSSDVCSSDLGDDYHEIIKTRLHQLADWLRQTTGAQTRACVDTAPVMEKELAARAGVGWLGKKDRKSVV